MTATRFCGVVGSRRRNTLYDRRLVFLLVDWLVSQSGGPPVIVSGGCRRSADEFAEEAAGVHGLDTIIYPIDRKGLPWDTNRTLAYQMFTERAHARNRLIAMKSVDGLYCLVADDRTGGTESTIRHALDLQVPVFLVTNSGEVFLYQDGSLPRCEPAGHLLDLKSTD